MGKFIPPEVQQRENAVGDQVKQEAKMDNMVGVPSTASVSRPGDIYKNRIDDLVKFLKHEINSGTTNARTDYQGKVIDSFNQLVELDYVQFEDVMDHFIRTVARNETVFGDAELFSAVYHVESRKTRPVDQIQRYKWFMTFFVGMARNIRERARYVAGHDITKLLSKFPVGARENLHNYIYR